MKKKQIVGSVLSAAVASVAVTWAQQAHAVIRINEIMIDAPGTNATQDYIELSSSTPSETVTGLTMLLLEGDTGALNGSGVIDTIIPLTGSTGVNGLYLRHSFSVAPSPAISPDTVQQTGEFSPPPVHENLTVSWILVSGFTGALAQDLDTNDDGVLDVTPWTGVVDAVGVSDSSSATDRVYGAALGGADFSQAVQGTVPRAILRDQNGTMHGASVAGAVGGPYTVDDSDSIELGYALSPGNLQNTVTAPSRSWIGISGGDFGTGTNWRGGVAPSVAGDIAMLDGAGGTVLTLSANATVGTLSFNGGGHTVAAGGGTLTFDTAATNALILVHYGNPTIAAPISLSKSTDISVARGQTLTTATISGIGSLRKLDAGTLVLNGTNSYSGGTIVNTGMLVVSADANLGDVNGGVTINNGTLAIAENLTLPSTRLITLTGVGAPIGVATGKTATVAGNITGAGGLTSSGPGTLVVNGATVDYTGATTVSSGTLRLERSLTTSSALSVNGTSVMQLASDGSATRVIKTGLLTVATGAKLDLADNKLITTSALGDWNGLTYTDVAGLVDRGRGELANAQWDGTGIITSDTRAVNNNDLVSIGTAKLGTIKAIADGDTIVFAGQTVLGSDTVAMVTWGGDANLDGKINIDDYGQIDFNVGSSGSVFGWYNGDFNYDGKINIDDYGIIDFNVSAQSGVFPTAGGLEGVAAVPEPAGVALVGLALLLRRRRATA